MTGKNKNRIKSSWRSKLFSLINGIVLTLLALLCILPLVNVLAISLSSNTCLLYTSSVLQRLETNSLAVCGHQMLFMIKRQKIMLCTGLLLMQEIITVKKQFFIAAQRILKNFQSRKFYMSGKNMI